MSRDALLLSRYAFMARTVITLLLPLPFFLAYYHIHFLFEMSVIRTVFANVINYDTF